MATGLELTNEMHKVWHTAFLNYLHTIPEDLTSICETPEQVEMILRDAATAEKYDVAWDDLEPQEKMVIQDLFMKAGELLAIITAQIVRSRMEREATEASQLN